MRLSDIKGEAAIDAVADLIEPVSEIAVDKKVVELFRNGQRLKAISGALKGHRRAVIEILAILDQKSPEEYMTTVTLASLPMQALDILNDPELAMLFTDAVETEKPSSTPATENTEASGM